jgi:hypothetical protein
VFIEPEASSTTMTGTVGSAVGACLEVAAALEVPAVSKAMTATSKTNPTGVLTACAADLRAASCTPPLRDPAIDDMATPRYDLQVQTARYLHMQMREATCCCH